MTADNVIGSFDLSSMLSCFQSGTVVDNLANTDKFAAIHEVVERAGVFADPQQRAAVERAVCRRERIQTTGLGHGIAAAHGQTAEVREVKIALGISRVGVDYHAMDGEPVKFLFVLATPPNTYRDYLTALSGICRLSKREFFDDLLSQNMTEQELQQKICQAFNAEIRRGAEPRPSPTRHRLADSTLMLIFPAIDLLAGRPVRLTQGDFGRATDYARDAVGTAVELEALGAAWLHLVDLDAARGSGDNRSVIRAIRGAVGLKLQVGGGVRSLADAERLLEIGVDRVVVGSALARDPELPSRWAATVGRRLVAGIDADAGAVKTDGWQQRAATADTELAARIAHQPVCGIVYTSIERDGTLSGPDLPRTLAVARAGRLPVILSGGIGSAQHVAAVAEHTAAGVAGVIIGKAWIEGRVDLAALLQRYPQEAASTRW